MIPREPLGDTEPEADTGTEKYRRRNRELSGSTLSGVAVQKKAEPADKLPDGSTDNE
jgi:hypothetical protein